MKDLHVPSGPGLPSGLVVPDADLVERFSRSPGPGGQSVNTSDSRVELEYDVRTASTLTEAQRARALRRWPDGVVAIAASEHRSQHRNRVAARERLAALLREALAPPPPPRRATRPTRGSKERRLQAEEGAGPDQGAARPGQGLEVDAALGRRDAELGQRLLHDPLDTERVVQGHAGDSVSPAARQRPTSSISWL